MAPNQSAPPASEPLKNARHEAFALAWAKGESATEAYRKAGYRAKDADTAGPRLSANVGIKARKEWLQAQTATRSILSRDDGLKILAEIAQDTEEPGQSRTGALKVIGQWCGWEKGTQAETLVAESMAAALRKRARR